MLCSHSPALIGRFNGQKNRKKLKRPATPEPKNGKAVMALMIFPRLLFVLSLFLYVLASRFTSAVSSPNSTCQE